MSMNTMNKAISTVNSVTKKASKVFANSLPVISIGMNVAGAAQEAQGDIPRFLRRLYKNYTGMDPDTGKFSLPYFMIGSGSLIVSGIVRKVLLAVA